MVVVNAPDQDAIDRMRAVAISPNQRRFQALLEILVALVLDESGSAKRNRRYFFRVIYVLISETQLLRISAIR
jgi:hypothetical protein